MTKLLLALTLLAVVPAFAVSFQTLAFQNQGFSTTPLGSGLDPLLAPEFGSMNYLGFETDFKIPGDDQWAASIQVPGFQGSRKLDMECDIPPFSSCGIAYGWSVPTEYHPTPGMLTVTLNGTTQSYDFQYQDPVPEPASLILLGLGGIALWRHLR